MSRLGYFIGGAVVGAIGVKLMQMFTSQDEDLAIADDYFADSEVNSDDYSDLDINQNTDL